MLEVAEQLGIEVVEGSFVVNELLDADEVFALSTIRQVASVVRIASSTFEPGPITALLRREFLELVKAETE